MTSADGETWRFYRRVTGPVFSERIHHAVWDESTNQARLMMQSWLPSSDPEADSVPIPSFGDDALRLGLNVITGAAYGSPLGWDENPPCATSTALSYHDSMEQLTERLMSLFLTPHWLLRLAPRDSTWGRAWEAYSAFGGYIRGMLDRERAHMNAGDKTEENLLTALIRAESMAEKDSRIMNPQEVMGNAFIFLFAGHETTANTLHYALIQLAQRPDIQQFLLDEVDELYERAAQEGRHELEYELDFNRGRWAFAILVRKSTLLQTLLCLTSFSQPQSETLRMYSPAGVTNKWSAADQPITFEGRIYAIPQGTRISINGTGVHANPKVWGDNAREWEPSRWIVEGGDCNLALTPQTSREPSPAPRTSRYSPPPSPGAPLLSPTTAQQQSRPSLSRSSSITSTSSSSTKGLLKPAKGTFLAFSEGSRACSGKKFATVKFAAVLFALFRNHRVELEEGWSVERVRTILKGRKAGALTLQPPEAVPLRFIKR